MTVALAFKALAKAVPCLTPFLATSDPSVLKRILAYIRGLPCSSNIFSKKVILTYMVRSSLYEPIVQIYRDMIAHQVAILRAGAAHDTGCIDNEPCGFLLSCRGELRSCTSRLRQQGYPLQDAVRSRPVLAQR